MFETICTLCTLGFMLLVIGDLVTIFESRRNNMKKKEIKEYKVTIWLEGGIQITMGFECTEKQINKEIDKILNCNWANAKRDEKSNVIFNKSKILYIIKEEV